MASWIYGAIFIILALTFSHTLKERVPLYLTNRKTQEAIRKALIQFHAQKFIDLGSGGGGVVRAAADLNIISIGVESAPLVWFLSSIISKITFKGKILRQNIWETDLSDYDVVYAFLSPAIMEKLYLKIHTEMKSGGVFISNSFAVVGVEPYEIWQLDDQRETILYLYKK